MKIFASLIVLAIMAVLAPGGALGGGKNGFGVYGGLVGHTFHREQDLGDPLDFSSVGLNLTGDAQFVINESWSIVPSLMFSAERTSNIFNVPGDTRGSLLSYNAILQGRFWIDQIYLAAHLGVYQESITTHSGQVFETGDGGFGLAIGFESTDGLILNIHYDFERPFKETEEVHAVRIQAGYRFQ